MDDLLFLDIWKPPAYLTAISNPVTWHASVKRVTSSFYWENVCSIIQLNRQTKMANLIRSGGLWGISATQWGPPEASADEFRRLLKA